MPVRYVIDKERRLVVTTGWDRVTSAEITATQEQLRNDPDLNPDFNHLIDTTGVTVMDVSLDDAKRIASRGVFSSVSKGAVVATTPAIFGMGRLMQVHHDIAKLADEVRTFYDRDAALKWLGVDNLSR